jgi:hypothetical protein
MHESPPREFQGGMLSTAPGFVTPRILQKVMVAMYGFFPVQRHWILAAPADGAYIEWTICRPRLNFFGF